METRRDATPAPKSVMPDVLRLLDGAGARGVLVGTRCRRCGAANLGRHPCCINCTSADVEVVDLSTKGSLVSYTIVHRAAGSWQGQVPYALGDVELPEGVRVTSEIVDCVFDTLHVGMALELTMRVGGHDAENNPIVVYKWTPPAG